MFVLVRGHTYNNPNAYSSAESNMPGLASLLACSTLRSSGVQLSLVWFLQDDENSNCMFVSRSLSWTGNSLASSFDGCELDARSQSVVAPSLDAASLSLHEGLLSGDSKNSSSEQIQVFPVSLDSSASVVALRNARQSDSFRRTSPVHSQPSSSAPSSQQAACLASETCVRGEVASNAQLRIPVTTAREAPEPSMKACVVPSVPTSRSQPSAAATQDSQISGADECPSWLAHRETQSAILEMLDEETVAAINPNYMEYHSDAVMPDGLCITPAMRLMTINWMSEAIYALDLDQVCLPPTVSHVQSGCCMNPV